MHAEGSDAAHPLLGVGMGNTLVTGLAVALLGLAAIRPAAAEWAALSLILVAGIPHGAFDLRIAEAQWLPLMRSRAAVLALYVSIGAAMSAFCLLAPAAGLLAFLAVSAVHFSEGEHRGSGRVTAAIFGVAAILCPIGLHAHEAGGYLEFFVPAGLFVPLAPLLARASLALWMLALGAVALDLVRGRRDECLQRAVSLAGWLLLPPLSGFAVWFIGRHSRQHLALCRGLFAGSRFGVPLDFAVISVLAVGLIAPLSLRFDLSDIRQLFAASIVLIAGLTLPHMIVSHGLPGTLRLLRGGAR